MGRRNKGRAIDGVLLLDKDRGMTSNSALQQVKRLFRAAKAGHTGSLDPLATGMLPICLGEATKLSGYLLDADKHYRVVCRLGEKTATADADGEVVQTAEVPELDEQTVLRVLERFTGDTEQVPPMYSALKHEGRRLYDLARAGEEVERQPRRVRIFTLALEAMSSDSLTFDVRCSKGTYIRTLVEDIAVELGTLAHVIELRRVGVGSYEKRPMYSLAELASQRDEQGDAALDRLLLPVDSAVADWPVIRLDEDMSFYMRRGQPLQVPRAPTEGRVRLYTEAGEFLGIGEIADDGRIAPKRLLAAGG